MPYRENLNRWLVVRLLANMQRVVVARHRKQSDADGYLRVIQRLIPDDKFLVVFDGDSKSDNDCRDADLSRLMPEPNNIDNRPT